MSGSGRSHRNPKAILSAQLRWASEVEIREREPEYVHYLDDQSWPRLRRTWDLRILKLNGNIFTWTMNHAERTHLKKVLRKTRAPVVLLEICRKSDPGSPGPDTRMRPLWFYVEVS